MVPFPLDVRRTLSVHSRGPGDPAYRVDESGAVWRTSLTPDGPATLRLSARQTQAAQVGAAGPRHAHPRPGLGAWRGLAAGPRAGPAWASPTTRLASPCTTPSSPSWCSATRGCGWAAATGCSRRSSPPCWSRRWSAWRPTAPGVTWSASTADQHLAPRRTACGSAPPPGPGRGSPPGTGTGPAWRGSGPAPSCTAAEVAGRLEETLDLPPAEADRRLRSLPGIGPWTSAEIRQRAAGDPDAVSVGDYNLPKAVGWTLARRITDDAAMLELLAPYAGQRYRVTRLIELARQAARRAAARGCPSATTARSSRSR